jgi:hypothetical protein
MKIVLAVVIMALFTISANAQANFGAKAGLNLYKISADEGDNSDMKAGFHIGMLAHIHMSDNFALQPELVYSSQGAKTEVDGDKVNFNLNYVNVPLLFQYMFDNGFRLEAGPQIGFLASAKYKNDGNSVDIKEGFNSIEFGVPLGVGYISPSGFGVDARYNIGLSNINETDNVKAHNRGFQLGVFYQFNHADNGD